MKKVIFAFMVFLVVVGIILGLPNRLTYEGFQHASGLIEEPANDIQLDYAKLKTLSVAMGQYNTKYKVQIFTLTMGSQHGSSYSVWYEAYDSNDNLKIKKELYITHDVDEYKEFLSYAECFEHPIYDDNILGALSSIGFVILQIMMALSSIIWLILDILPLTGGLVAAFFYLIGF